MLSKSKLSISFVLISFLLSFNMFSNENTQLGITAATTLTTVLGNEASMAITTKSFNKKCIPSGEKYYDSFGDVSKDEVTCVGETAIETMQCNTYECSVIESACEKNAAKEAGCVSTCSEKSCECEKKADTLTFASASDVGLMNDGSSSNDVTISTASTCSKLQICEANKTKRIAAAKRVARSKQRTCRNLCRTKKHTALALGLAGTSAGILSTALSEGEGELDPENVPEDTLTCNQAKQTEEVYNRCVCEKELGGAYKDGQCYTGMGAGGEETLDNGGSEYSEEDSYGDVDYSEATGPNDESTSDDENKTDINGAGEGSFTSPSSSKNKKKNKKKKDDNTLKHNANNYKSFAGRSQSSNALGSSSSKSLSIGDNKKEDKKEKGKDITNKGKDIFKIVEKKYQNAYMAQRIQDSFFDSRKFRKRVKGSKK